MSPVPLHSVSDPRPLASDLWPGRLSIIVAMASNGVIGRDGTLPWRLSADLKRFKRLTMGRPIIMGRRTWESIRRPLPGRTSIVVSRRAGFRTRFPEVLVASDCDEALRLAAGAPGGDVEAFAIGGEEIFRAALPTAQRLHLTRVLAEVEGDAHFPEFDPRRWRLTSSEPRAADADNDYAHRFEVYERITP